MSRSVLGHILPEAMVCYLENYSADKFAQIFLGEFDTPEAIWNAEMRLHITSTFFFYHDTSLTSYYKGLQLIIFIDLFGVTDFLFWLCFMCQQF